ncbi:hypothetical protein PTB13_15475, partial [Bacillus sp. MHSD17]|nr:hypothetical protein [Bacillus sp. MHSD17]
CTQQLLGSQNDMATIRLKLDSIPVVQEFKSSQTYVNDLLQLVASTISNNVTDEILISTNGDVLKGETGAAVESKKGNCGC